MKNISYEEAKSLINSGITIKCLISRNAVPIKSLNDLENQKHLADEKVQGFKLYYEPEPMSIPDNAMEISLDDAFTLLHEGEIVYTLKNNTEIPITHSSELISYYRSCEIQGNPCIFYWYID